MMKVLHVLDHSIPDLDGYCIRSQNLVQFQTQHQIEPVVVTSAQHKPIPNGDIETFDGIRYYRTPAYRESKVPFVREMQRVRKFAARIDKVVEIEQPDLLHAHSPCLWGQATAKVARRRGLPFVYEVRGFWEDAAVDSGKTNANSLRYRFSRALETRVCRKADAVTTIADGLKNDITQRGISSRKVFLAKNGVAVDRFRPLEPDQELIAQLELENCVSIGYVGTLYAWEGVDDLVRAVPEVIRRAPQTRFLIIGDGELAPRIRELIGQLDVGGHVRFVGRVPHEEIAAYYSVLDVLVYPRRSTRNTELCTPLKPLESMAMEKAVIGSDIGGIRELLVDGAGLLYRAGDPADLADKCLTLVTDPEMRQRLGKRARKHVVADRNWDALAARYIEVYRNAAAAYGSPIADNRACVEPEATELVTANSTTE